MADENKVNPNGDVFDLSSLGSFDFTPAWAKSDAGDKNKYVSYSEGEKSDTHERRRDRDERKGGERRREERGNRGNRNRSRDGEKGRKEGFRKVLREFIKPLDAQVRILPSQKDIGIIIRKIQTSHYAYPLKQLANLFLENPAATVLRFSPKKDGEVVTLQQCKACGHIVETQDELLSHIMSTHLTDYFIAETVECEPPKGQFPCVARCGMSGELLGPPNLHGYDERIREMISTRYPNMTESEYRSKIEMVRDSDVVEQWRASATTKIIYRKKGDKEAPAVDRDVAELDFRRNIANNLMSSVTTFDVTADVAAKSSYRPLIYACNDALRQERRFPGSIMFALRGAFHNRKLVFFRANDSHGPEFVVAAKPQNLDLENAIPELVEIVKFVQNNPNTTQQALIKELSGDDSQKKADITTKLAWLAEKGYLICYVNGGVAVPCEHPLYRPPQQSKKKDAPKKEAASKTEEAPAVEAAPAVEEVSVVEETAPAASESPVEEEK